MENHLPDVLETLANLSSDEVFTPPQIANNVLDMLPQEIFKNKDAKFLDPCSKSGVFLREIAKRLDKGLENQIPDREERINHIMHNQIYGIGITYLTAFLSRRSLYGACYADTPYSLADFDIPEGNVLFHNMEHTWDKKGKCQICGANKDSFQGEYTDNHAYEFIHRDPKEIFNMKFDVIIGNPPYQLDDGGNGASAKPIYHYFVENAKKMNPKYLCMIMPARWYAGGKGLDDFRAEMLNDKRIKILHDYIISGLIFPGTRIAGGVCYFLWDRDYNGDCMVYNHRDGADYNTKMLRPLLEKNSDTFIRFNEAVSILRKVQSFKEESFSTIVSSRKPFGLPTDFFADPSKYNLPPVFDEKKNNNDLAIIGTLNYKTVTRYVSEKYPFPNGEKYIGKYKIFVSQVLDNGFDWTKEKLKPIFANKYDICTETFLCIGEFNDKIKAENTITYINTKFFHLLMHLKKVSHHVSAKVYHYVPMQDFSKPWTDEELYNKYGLTQEERDFIENTVFSGIKGADNGK